VTEAELFAGAEKNAWGPARVQALETLLRQYKLLDYRPEIPRMFAKVVAGRQRIGRPLFISGRVDCSHGAGVRDSTGDT
jgi:hypothetical protein